MVTMTAELIFTFPLSPPHLTLEAIRVDIPVDRTPREFSETNSLSSMQILSSLMWALPEKEGLMFIAACAERVKDNYTFTRADGGSGNAAYYQSKITEYQRQGRGDIDSSQLKSERDDARSMITSLRPQKRGDKAHEADRLVAMCALKVLAATNPVNAYYSAVQSIMQKETTEADRKRVRNGSTKWFMEQCVLAHEGAL